MAKLPETTKPGECEITHNDATVCAWLGVIADAMNKIRLIDRRGYNQSTPELETEIDDDGNRIDHIHTYKGSITSVNGGMWKVTKY